MIDGMKKLNILKRAMAQEEMFGDETDTVKLAAGAVRQTKKQKAAAEAALKDPKVTPIGEAARKVAERAGADQQQA